MTDFIKLKVIISLTPVKLHEIYYYFIEDINLMIMRYYTYYNYF